jgi:uncharacterized protein (DUF2267 family)
VAATDYEAFISTVARRGGLGLEEAARAAEASLETLAERITPGEAREIVKQMPMELSGWILSHRRGPQPFDVDEFLRRVARREGVDVETAEEHARAVFAALRAALDEKEIADLAAELPEDLQPLLFNLRLWSFDEFLGRVVEQTGLDPGGARSATEAVLETLAERLAPGEVDDLVARLPVQLHAALRRGAARADEHLRRVPVDEFVSRVAEREQVSRDGAFQHIRAVLATLRESIRAEEFSDITAQLPNDYAVLLPQPATS